MAIKRRQPKTRRTPEQEAALWGDYFDTGAWLLAGTVEALGFETHEAMDAAAEDAWHRLGALYLATAGQDTENPGAWAIERWGMPAKNIDTSTAAQ